MKKGGAGDGFSMTFRQISAELGPENVGCGVTVNVVFLRVMKRFVKALWPEHAKHAAKLARDPEMQLCIRAMVEHLDNQRRN